jgi:hypothetical protein
LPYIHDETGHRIATLEGDGEPFLLCARIFAEAPEMLAFTGRALAWLTGEIDGLVDEEIESAIAQERQPTDEAIRERLASEARAILSRIDG